ncbi:uncharacterized protein RMCC_2474 [Mycolicibacterium canariasense]|uniref:Uncharacterized protein n=1 Tax=Mycolicibacterium canariasense TaxID=228230 RepID=A0A117I9X9_MYCCR|nr:hypothetical protein [Mycolicibacterium canariasense]MCV7212629.1 hypothetical protein [Mycolicibacterium canariasense]ORV02529.1 hypothetical protein AWB94_00900 [Mycolicibacterium canariasense]GAS95508.1 uncharacterized protein RMCC_2474 [Mycolicibacterium canariasense]
MSTHIEGMSQPVRCRWCSGIYDLGTVEVTARYIDCSMWKTPCCGHTADDRGETGWKSFSDYERLDRPRPRGPVAYGGRYPWEG